MFGHVNSVLLSVKGHKGLDTYFLPITLHANTFPGVLTGQYLFLSFNIKTRQFQSVVFNLYCSSQALGHLIHYIKQRISCYLY